MEPFQVCHDKEAEYILKLRSNWHENRYMEYSTQTWKYDGKTNYIAVINIKFDNNNCLK